ncbi:hypothetical protein P8S54_02055 [Thiomicrospira sp. R3]|uniref:hypothetical protein n=1 Tax=Thiomicrospira sp. R3 TaxID=3035472 RepID=UPI00259BB4FD|nr:hypothetical protein [Thiomicrospira sp. R3]WFE69104.1 hypothetical protein P8S54_02055 [Thiomicrospira sp. R3]
MRLTPELRKKMRKAIAVSMQIEGYTIDTSAERRKYIKHLIKRYNVNVNVNLDKTFLNQAK